ncbi:hypothetical protein HAV_00930 [Candidatus Hepatincola sp. Av]
MRLYTSIFQKFTKLLLLFFISISCIFAIFMGKAKAVTLYGLDDANDSFTLNTNNYHIKNYNDVQYNVKTKVNRNKYYHSKPKNNIHIENNYYEDNDSLDLANDMADMIYFGKTNPNKMELKSTGQLDLAIGFNFILNDDAFAYNTFADEFALFVEMNPFYKVKFLNKIDIRLELVRTDDDLIDELNDCSANYSLLPPVYNAENIYIIYNLIKKDFLTFYVGYAIYNRYDVVYANKYNIPIYESGHGNNFIAGSNIFIGYNTFLILEYRIQQLKLPEGDYNYAKWALGIKTKFPLLD